MRRQDRLSEYADYKPKQKGHKERSFHGLSLELPRMSFPNLQLLSKQDRTDTLVPKYKITVHDRDQYELKVELAMSPKEEQHYTIEVFIFMPRSLATGSRGKDRFYDNLWCTMRLATPKVSLDLLSDERGPVFSVLEDSVSRCCSSAAAGAGGDPAVADTARQLQVLACVYQSVFKHETKQLAEAQEAERRSAVEILAMARTRLQGISAALGLLRSMESTVCAPHVPPTVQGVWQELDEYVSLSAEASLVKMIRILEREVEAQKAACAQPGAEPDVRSTLEELQQLKHEAITIEASHRRIEGYATHWSLTNPHQNEVTASRFHQLKYACQESLALSFKASAPSMFIFDTVGIFAAAASMVFAYLITMWAQRTFGTQVIGVQLLIIVTVVYVVKDRIKEWGKRYITPYLVRWFAPSQMADRRRMVRDANGRHVGWLRETYVPAVDHRHVDPMVIQVRWADAELPEDAARKDIASGVDRAAARAVALGQNLAASVAQPLEGVMQMQPVSWVKAHVATHARSLTGGGGLPPRASSDQDGLLAGASTSAGDPSSSAAAAAKEMRADAEAEQGREKQRRRRSNWREAALMDGVDAAGGEYCECYRKEVDLTADHSREYSWSRLLRRPGATEDDDDEKLTKLYDCSRISISKMRHRMSAPSEKQHVLDPATQKVVTVECSRVYSFHLVIRIRHTRGRGPLAWGSEVFERAEVVADQNGIRRVQALGTVVGGFRGPGSAEDLAGGEDGGGGAGAALGPRPASPGSPRRGGRPSVSSRGALFAPGTALDGGGAGSGRGAGLFRQLQAGRRSLPSWAAGALGGTASHRFASYEDDEETGGLRPDLGEEAPDGLRQSELRAFGAMGGVGARGVMRGGDEEDMARAAAMGNKYNDYA